jgi:hypothetical protein
VSHVAVAKLPLVELEWPHVKSPTVGQGNDFAGQSQNSGQNKKSFLQVNGSRSNGDIVLLYEGHCLLKGQSLVSTSIFVLTHCSHYIHLAGEEWEQQWQQWHFTPWHHLLSISVHMTDSYFLNSFLGPRAHLPFELLTVLCFYTSTFLSSPTARHTSQWRKTFRHFPSCLNP